MSLQRTVVEMILLLNVFAAQCAMNSINEKICALVDIYWIIKVKFRYHGIRFLLFELLRDNNNEKLCLGCVRTIKQTNKKRLPRLLASMLMR